MLQWMHGEFGLVGSLIMAYILFIFFIFWIAGLAGINESKYSDDTKMNMLIIGIIVPPYPILWLIKEIYRQNRVLKEGKHGIR
ncbi:MAG: hypothetical protein WD038_02755 [Balneolales bacterium]